MGSGFNTHGDYYYVNGCHQGVYEVENPYALPMIINSQDSLLNTLKKMNLELTLKTRDGESLQFVKFSKTLDAFNAEAPVNDTQFYEDFMKNLNLNLESGFITEEEQQQYLAELNQYANVLPEK